MMSQLNLYKKTLLLKKTKKNMKKINKEKNCLTLIIQ